MVSHPLLRFLFGCTLSAFPALLVSLPSASFWPPAIITIVVGLGFVLFGKRMIPATLRAQIVGIAIGVLSVVVPLFLVFTPAARFFEQGSYDGPFYGKPFAGDLSLLTEDAKIRYCNAGWLVAYNRGADESPILAFFTNGGALRWSTEMDVTTNPKFSNDHLERIEFLSVSSGLFRNSVSFGGHWTYGAEHGTAYIWKTNVFHRYYLSW